MTRRFSAQRPRGIAATLAIAAALAIAAVTTAGAAGKLVPAPGDPAPGLVAASLDGVTRVVSWSDDKVTVVNFWAPWCEPCRDEMPALQELWESHAEEGLAVYGVHMLGPVNEEIWGFLDEVGARYPILLGDVDTARRWFVNLLPTTYLVRSDGTIARRYVGAAPGHVDALVADVEALLEGRPLGTLRLPDKADESRAAPPPGGP